MISWKTLGRETRLLPPDIQQQCIKFITRHISNYHMMQKRGEIEINKYTDCNCNIFEKSSHISVNANNKAKRFFMTKINVELKKELETKQTLPNIIIIILDILKSWRNNNSINISNYNVISSAGQAVREQHRIE